MSSFPTCQVCHQQFSLKGPAPFLLPCLHAMCETCVTSAAGGDVSCSTCQRDVNLTETPLQKDVVREKEILHLTTQRNPELVLCTHEEDGNQAICWCKECEDFLCENCQMTHGRLKITRQHVVEDIGDLQPESFDVDEYCTIHPKFVLDTWDEECSILICAKCKLGDHAEHKTADIGEACETTKQDMTSLDDEIKGSLAQQGAHLATVETDLQASDETCCQLTVDISHTFNTLKTPLDQREKELHIELQHHKDKVRRGLMEKKNISEACQKKCQTASDYIRKSLQYSSRHNIMALRNILQSEGTECISSARAIVHKRPVLTRFNTVGLEKIKSVLTRFGAIVRKEGQTVAAVTTGKLTDSGITKIDPTSGEVHMVKQKLIQPKSQRTKEIRSMEETFRRDKKVERKSSGMQTDDLTSGEFQMLKKKPIQLTMKHEKKMRSLEETFRREKNEERKSTRVDFSATKYNAKYVHINTEAELINRKGSPTSTSGRRLRRYAGTSSIVPLPRCESRQYFEVKINLGIDERLSGNNLLFEIGMTTEENQDKHPFVTKHRDGFSLTVEHCSKHKSICRRVWRHGVCVKCLPNTFRNTPGTSATLHYGVIYDSVSRRIGYIDVKNEKVIGTIGNVDTCSAQALWPMFGVSNSHNVEVSMSLVVGSDIDMSERKKELVSQCASTEIAHKVRVDVVCGFVVLACVCFCFVVCLIHTCTWHCDNYGRYDINYCRS